MKWSIFFLFLYCQARPLLANQLKSLKVTHVKDDGDEDDCCDVVCDGVSGSVGCCENWFYRTSEGQKSQVTITSSIF